MDDDRNRLNWDVHDRVEPIPPRYLEAFPTHRRPTAVLGVAPCLQQQGPLGNHPWQACIGCLQIGPSKL